MITTLNLESVTSLNREKFSQLCINNPELQLERNPQGELIRARGINMRDRYIRYLSIINHLKSGGF